MDICARVDMNVGISFVRLSIVNANECVRIVSGQHMARNTRATQTPGRERFFLQGELWDCFTRRVPWGALELLGGCSGM